jgi:hypothetical protein
MNEKLIDLVLEQIQADVLVGDYTALVELLKFVPEQYLRGYLSEELV